MPDSFTLKPIPDPNEVTLHPNSRVERREFIRQAGEKRNPFTAALKTNGRWLKQFLHTGK